MWAAIAGGPVGRPSHDSTGSFSTGSLEPRPHLLVQSPRSSPTYGDFVRTAALDQILFTQEFAFAMMARLRARARVVRAHEETTIKYRRFSPLVSDQRETSRWERFGLRGSSALSKKFSTFLDRGYTRCRYGPYETSEEC